MDNRSVVERNLTGQRLILWSLSVSNRILKDSCWKSWKITVNHWANWSNDQTQSKSVSYVLKCQSQWYTEMISNTTCYKLDRHFKLNLNVNNVNVSNSNNNLRAMEWANIILGRFLFDCWGDYCWMRNPSCM